MWICKIIEFDFVFAAGAADDDDNNHNKDDDLLNTTNSIIGHVHASLNFFRGII